MRTYIKFGLLTAYLLATTISMAKTPCRIIYDAGSSGTRLYIYQKVGSRWISHKGPKTEAIADPIRQNRGRSWSDRTRVIDRLIDSLQQMHTKKITINPTHSKPTFDWKKQCTIESIGVYGTAGMRLAEQKSPKKSQQFWSELHRTFTEKFGPRVSVTTRTLSGFEEGLYSWLSLQKKLQSVGFGIIEVGGASLQIAHPCDHCQGSRIIKLNHSPPFYFVSQSFLGLGRDEAFKLFGQSNYCQVGAAKRNKDWHAQQCLNTINIINNHRIIDPLNFHDGKQWQSFPLPAINKNNIKLKWYINNANFKDDSLNQANCCYDENSRCQKNKSACFEPLYFQYLDKKLINYQTYKIKNASWTKGLLICQEQNCLRLAGKQNCHWLQQGCLTTMTTPIQSITRGHK